MTEDFNRRLAAYEKGELTGKEREQFEKELEKLEQYIDLLEQPEKNETNDDHPFKEKIKREQKIMRRGKWKARLSTALYAIVLLIAFTIVSTIVTALYYEWGSNRGETYRDIIKYTMTVTDPYGDLGSPGASINPFFNMVIDHDLNKRVGDKIISYGNMKVKFLLSFMSVPETTYKSQEDTDIPLFFYPGKGEGYDSDWDRLEKLPAGTVTSAYISFPELYDTKTVFDYIDGKDLELLWLAVDSGQEVPEDEFDIVIFNPIGFPANPIWHDDDFTLDSREETKGFLWGGTVSESYSSPDYEVGDTDILHEQFLKTLHFLNKHHRKANKLLFGQFNLPERLVYIEENGIQHYGIVITGPTKEILSLKDEPWISVLQIDEIELWDWYTYKDAS